MIAGTQTDARQVARDYIEQGLAAIPIPFRKKGPIVPDWQQLRLKAADVQNYFTEKNNVGVLLGEPSNWLIDIDLDHPIARELADEFLPSTESEFGRAGNPRSHRLYRVSEPIETYKRKLSRADGGKMLVELRSTGCQTVFPGSLHETTGEPIEWVKDGEPREIDPAELREAVDKLADEVQRRLGIAPKPQAKPQPTPRGPVRSTNAVLRCRKYVAMMDPAISGQRGQDQAFYVACEIWRFGLSESDAWDVMSEYNERCVPPFEEHDLRHKLDDAQTKVVANGEFGSRLRDDNQKQSDTASPCSDDPAPDPSDAGFADYDEVRGITDDCGEIGSLAEKPKADASHATDFDPPEAKKSKAVTNIYRVTNEDGEIVARPMPMAAVLKSTRKKTDDWPRRVDSALFVHHNDEISWITTAAALFGYFGHQTGPVDWHKFGGCVSKEETFHEFRRLATRYHAVELHPHYPRMEGTYYAHRELPAGDGSKLHELLDRFCPQTQIDRDLLLASLMTLAWGGRGGARPAFVLTAESGRGAGKSKFVEMAGHVFGGLITFSNNEDAGQIKSRLLSPEGMACRACLLDNVKTSRFSWAELEAMITAPVISGKRMYVGEGRRPNTLTWFVTLNGPSLSTDMAQRSIVIKLGNPKRTGIWEQETIEFIEQNRQVIIADLIDCLKGPAFPLTKFSRWATWEAAVLSRLPEPNEAQKVILERQGEVDGDAEESDLLQDFFGEQLGRLNYSVVIDQVFIPTDTATKWFNWCQRDNQKPTAVTRMLKQLNAEGRLPRIKICPSRTHGRGFVWTGEQADTCRPMATDIRERLAMVGKED